MLNIIKGYIKRQENLKKYNNVVEAAYLSRFTRNLSGISVFVLESTSNDRIISKFSLVGFVFYLISCASYLYCTYTVREQDQSILRNIYKTKLKHYGDDFEWVASTIYAAYSLWKVPINLSGSAGFVQEIVNIDHAIKSYGDNINYSETAIQILSISIGQMAVYLLRMISIWGTFENLKVAVPIEKMFQVVTCVALALIVTAHYCYDLMLLKFRFKWVNKTLKDIKCGKWFEYKVLVRNRVSVNMVKVIKLRDTYICERIRSCARIYGLLYKATEKVNKIYSLALMLTLFLYFNYIILYMFYFMEAHASGLFHDVKKYVDFIIYFIWQLIYALGIIYLNLYFCESVVSEAGNASAITHEIINSDLGHIVAREAMQFSTQLLHQKPSFTAAGRFQLNYGLLQQGGSAVVTYLIILLQFVIKKE